MNAGTPPAPGGGAENGLPAAEGDVGCGADPPPDVEVDWGAAGTGNTTFAPGSSISVPVRRSSADFRPFGANPTMDWIVMP